MRRQVSRTAVILAALIGFAVGALTLGHGLPGPSFASSEDFYSELEKQLNYLAEAVVKIEQNFIEEAEPDDLIYGAISGMVRQLKDRNSNFMEPKDYRLMREETAGEFGGLGIVIGIREEWLTVIAPMPGTPAWEVGILAGDRIVRIEDEPTTGMSLPDAVSILRGKVGTDVTITVSRNGKVLDDITITRAVIKIDSVKHARMIDENIGYVWFAEFQRQSGEDLEDALRSLEEQGMKALIFDLRNDTGGLLDVAVEVTDKFIPAGEVIVSTRGRHPNASMVRRATKGATHPDVPMVVLINGLSASGAEIVAGAIKDHGRGILIGSTSFGKGSVQNIIPLADESALRLTTAKYYTPSGVCIDGTGIEPDIAVPITPEMEMKIFGWQKGVEPVVDEPDESEGNPQPDAEERPDAEEPPEADEPEGPNASEDGEILGDTDWQSEIDTWLSPDTEDPQLEAAVDVLRGHLLMSGMVKRPEPAEVEAEAGVEAVE